MATALKRMRYGAEYALARAVAALAVRVPFGVAAGLARAMADLGYVAMRSRRRIAVRNVLHCGIRATERDAKRLVRESYRHLGVALVESLRFNPLLEDGSWREHVRLAMPSELEQHLRDPKRGLILASGHYGNWEVAAKIFSQYKTTVGVARPLDNPRVDRLVHELRQGRRFRSIPKHDADPLRMLQTVRGGEALALMIDQHAGPRGVLVDFLGQPASTHSAVALMALVTRLPLYFGYCRRTAPLSFDCRVFGPVDCSRSGNKSDDVHRILTELNGYLENAIRETPEQYLWSHRRWRPEEVRGSV
jgi:KDO2-lipid IV(A) lauroyltransferase